MRLIRDMFRKAGAALLAAGLLAFGQAGWAADAAPQDGQAYIQLLGTKGGPSLLQIEALPQSMAIVSAGGIVIVDAGYGASYRLVESGLKLRDIREIYITHLHSDHILDYPALLMNGWASGWKAPIRAYGPSGLAALTDNMWKMFAVDIDLRIADEGRPDPRQLLSVTEVDAGPVAVSGLVRASALRVPHSPFPPGQALAWRFEVDGHAVVVTGDLGAYPDGFVEFARDADVLVSEVVEPDAVARLAERIGNGGDRLAHAILSHHVTPAEVGRIAQAANVKKVVLTHRIPVDDPQVTDATWMDGVRQAYDGEVIVGHDLRRIGLGD